MNEVGRGNPALFLLPFVCYNTQNGKQGGEAMPNYGKYYIAVRLLLLKQYLEANVGGTSLPDLF